MNLRRISFWICLSALIASCAFAADQTDDISSDEARNLIQRNVMLSSDRFPIDNPQAYQYGTVHIDGPSGGMLYRFGSNSEALQWIVEQHQMKQIAVTMSSPLPLQFLNDRPQWWEPDKLKPDVYYVLSEKLPMGGERQFIVVYDTSTSEIYAVEHYSNMVSV